ncbi:MAG: hypothetical protein JRK53_03535 [Deltaproteobacteria bacterium]|nr:hypothetical protein [Deltaproteobacteria bacterium]MBW1819783.1 hypothetical protein [Deltaproteobacteria bacterium]
MLFSKKTLMLLCLAAACYFMLNYHFLFYGGRIELLEKSRMTFDYTFFNIAGKKPASILMVDDLRHDGIGRILVELGMLSEDRMLALVEKYDSQ